MIILHFHPQPQYKYELFHINFTTFHCTGRYELNKLTSLPMCGFITQLVEHRTGIAEVTGSNPVEALIFSGFFFPIAYIGNLTGMIIFSFSFKQTMTATARRMSPSRTFNKQHNGLRRRATVPSTFSNSFTLRDECNHRCLTSNSIIIVSYKFPIIGKQVAVIGFI